MAIAQRAAAARRRRLGLHRHLSPAARQRLIARLRAMAAKRRRLGLHRHLSPAARQRLIGRLRAIAARRRLLGLKRHLSPAARAKLVLRLRTMAQQRRGQHATISSAAKARLRSRPHRFIIRRSGPARQSFHIKARTPRTSFRIKSTRRRKH